MTTSKISIIIPIYNTDKYLPTCLDSIIAQTYKNIEIICINDGSPDNSLQILEKYAQKDSRMKIINQENKGVSVARNNGTNNATGEYILFVDADDWLELNCCEQLIKNIGESDIIIFDTIRHINNKIRINKHLETREDQILLTGIWNKMYKSTFLKSNKLLFPTGITHSEDFIFNNYIYIIEPKIKYCPEYLYNYRMNREGCATQNWENRIHNDIKSFTYFKETENFKNLMASQKLTLIDYWARVLFNCWSTMPIKNLQKEYDLALDSFLKNYKIFNKKEYKNMIGYKRIKYKNLIKFFKNIRDLFIYLSCKKDSENA